MTLGLFTDDFHPHIGGIGRYVYEVTRRIPEDILLIFSPCQSAIRNHIQVQPPFHNKLRNLSFSYWLHQNVNRIIKTHNLSRINIQCGPGGLFLLRKLDQHVVATCHHTWWQQSRYITSQIWKRIFTPFEKLTYQLADRIICDSEDSKTILTDKYGISAGKVVVIPIGIDTQKFYPIDSIKKLPFSILYVGRIDKRKGVDFLIRAMKRVSLVISNVKLYVGGIGKDLLKLKAYVNENALKKHVKFIGFIPEDKLNSWYNMVQCVIIPSMFEGFGLTAIEAMAAGTNVIATNVDSLRNIVEDGVTGVLVNYGDVDCLAEKIIYLLNNQIRREELRREALERVATVYNWDRIMQSNMNELFALTEEQTKTSGDNNL
jgi:glycosyltransferase involved in cell wall biosynthesis